MKQSTKITSKTSAIFQFEPVFYLSCLWLLMDCNTGLCKMPQADLLSDPFAEIERENPDLFKPTISSEGRNQQIGLLPGSKVKKGSGYVELNPQAHGSTEPRNPDQPAGTEDIEEFHQLFTQLSSKKRPIFPERSKPGGLISSCGSDPLMSSELESLLDSKLNSYDCDSWNDMSIADLATYLGKRLPTYLDVRALEEEGIEPDQAKVVKQLPFGSLRSRLQDALRPFGLTYALRHGRLEITTEGKVEDGEGVLRIYDVTPLVSQIRDGVEQLHNTVTVSIVPDCWLNNGGSSTISFHVVPGETESITTAVITCPSSTHLRVQDLLDRLNSLAGQSSRSTPLNHSIKNSTSPVQNLGTSLKFDERPRLYGGF